MADLLGLVPPQALMVFNDSRVRKSRLFAVSETTGAAGEFLFIGHEAGYGPEVWRVMARNARRVKPGQRYRFGGLGSLVSSVTTVTFVSLTATVLDAPELAGSEFRLLCFAAPLTEAWFEEQGHVPLPPYISRRDTPSDAERYQTIYARVTGSAAAPTAGLHFTADMLRALEERGIEQVHVTLHVGLGTFLPLRTDVVEEHVMHHETYSIDAKSAAAINAAKAAHRPILAVGTTSVRTLEAAAAAGGGTVQPGTAATDIFIYPGYTFRVTDALFTNFHTPESTLLMLVSAFAGRAPILAAYAEAVKEGYRFFSYGDAMLIV
jgi:S-adenosylmethionine:tRNA ribosyltransferase-isomerase